MRLDLLSLVPVLGGYVFLMRAYRFRYEVMYDTGYHLFFKSAVTGAVLIFVSYCMLLPFFIVGALFILDVEFPSTPPDALNTLAKALAASIMYGLDAVAKISTVLVGYCLASVVNKKQGKERSSQRIAESRGDRFELCISEAFVDKKPVEVSLETGKSYIGIPSRTLLAHRKDPDIELLVLASGHRDKDTCELNITTFYNQGRADARLIIVPMSRIVSMRVFDLDYYLLNVMPSESNVTPSTAGSD